MPQMAPLNWLSLMIFFMLILLIFNLENYFSFFYPIKYFKSNNKNIIKYNWKW
uniref:ATP synthase complex subunit 8 n=1 Tax=Callosobruchus analis TaxID=380381 RepID=A0A343KPV4_9CUCU|nr:ATP synthase F0 subunit 8 [Callosobruchus analis]